MTSWERDRFEKRKITKGCIIINSLKFILYNLRLQFSKWMNIKSFKQSSNHYEIFTISLIFL